MLWSRYKNKRHPVSNQLFKEEVLNVVTHLSALLIFSFLSGMLLVKTKYFWQDLIFCIANIHLFASSVVYHYFEKKKLKEKLQLLDHSAINLLMAGSYTPLAFYIDNYIILAIIWTMAITNILEMWYYQKVNSFSLIKYLAMGWMLMFLLPSLWVALPISSLVCIILGGISYTA